MAARHGKDSSAARRQKQEMLRKLADLLSDEPDQFSNIEAVLEARVPIVKFRAQDGTRSYECDVNCNNLLGQRNSLLLRTYGEIDERFTQLGFAVKAWAKRLAINDASEGYFSSYSLVCMCLAFLQRTEPPVLPYLQQLEKGDQEVRIHGWDTYFFEDSGRIAEVFPEHKTNKQSLGQLFMDFFDYYAKFDWNECVVCCREAGERLKSDKEWKGAMIAVEDPFDLSHNLTKNIQGACAFYALKCIRNAREVFYAALDDVKLAQLKHTEQAEGSLAVLYQWFEPAFVKGLDLKRPISDVRRRNARPNHSAASSAASSATSTPKNKGKRRPRTKKSSTTDH